MGKADPFNVAADATFREAKGHPGFETSEHARLDLRVLRQVEVEAVGPGVHQFFKPGGARGVLSLKLRGVDVELHPKILVDLRFAFCFGEATEGGEIVGFNADKVVFGLRVERPVDGVRIRFAI